MSADHSGRVLHEGQRFRVVDCRECGFAHLDPRPTAAELAEFYRKQFFDEENPDYLEKTERELDYWNHVVFAAKQRHLRAFAGRAGRLLDVGCCGGFLLHHMREAGWEVQGVEPGETAANWAESHYDLPIVRSLFEDVALEALGRFDAVHMAFVLEHVAEPLAILERAHSVLRPGGVLCVEVPNDFNRLQKAVVNTEGKDPWWVCWPDHINYFDFTSLERTFERCRFEVLRRDATFPMELFLLMGDDYIGREDVGLACHQKRMRLEREVQRGGVEDPLDLLYGGFAARGLGREATVYGRKR